MMEDDHKAGKIEEHGHPRRKALFLVLLLAGLTAGAYVHGIRYYGDRFLPKTSLDGVELGELTAEEAAQTLSESFAGGSLRIIGRDGAEETLVLDTANVRRVYTGLEQALEAQNRRLWIMERGREKAVTAPYHLTYDEAALLSAADDLQLLDSERMTAPVNAYIQADHTQGTYAIMPEEEGNTVDRVSFDRALLRAVENGAQVLELDASACYVEPAIRSDDERLTEKLRMTEALEKHAITLDMDAEATETLHGDAILRYLGGDSYIEGCRRYQWMTDVAEAEEQLLGAEEAETEQELSDSADEAEIPAADPEKFLPESDEKSLEDYVAYLAEQYDTFAEGEGKDFVTRDGEEIHIDYDYGWKLDAEKTAEVLRTAMTEAGIALMEETARGTGIADDTADRAETDGPSEGTTDDTGLIKAVWSKTAASHTGRDYGEYYAEVDLSGQKVYLMDHGDCIFESDCVSGRMVKGRMTPGGIYAITYKQLHRVLTGYKPDGSIDYQSPVTYWMPFNKGIGFHDATWRGSFGGSIYVYSGSHGCVNLPYSKAKELYSLVYKGMPVILYY